MSPSRSSRPEREAERQALRRRHRDDPAREADAGERRDGADGGPQLALDVAARVEPHVLRDPDPSKLGLLGALRRGDDPSTFGDDERVGALADHRDRALGDDGDAKRVGVCAVERDRGDRRQRRDRHPRPRRGRARSRLSPSRSSSARRTCRSTRESGAASPRSRGPRRATSRARARARPARRRGRANATSSERPEGTRGRARGDRRSRARERDDDALPRAHAAARSSCSSPACHGTLFSAQGPSPAGRAPTTTTSCSSSTPSCSRARRRASVISARQSALVAPPAFSMKFAWRGEMIAPPIRCPLSPHSSSMPARPELARRVLEHRAERALVRRLRRLAPRDELGDLGLDLLDRPRREPVLDPRDDLAGPQGRVTVRETELGRRQPAAPFAPRRRARARGSPPSPSRTRRRSSGRLRPRCRGSRTRTRGRRARPRARGGGTPRSSRHHRRAAARRRPPRRRARRRAARRARRRRRPRREGSTRAPTVTTSSSRSAAQPTARSSSASDVGRRRHVPARRCRSSSGGRADALLDLHAHVGEPVEDRAGRTPRLADAERHDDVARPDDVEREPRGVVERRRPDPPRRVGNRVEDEPAGDTLARRVASTRRSP